MKQGEVEILASRLLSVHGLKKLGWTYKFIRAKKISGQCYYDKKIIELSLPFVLVNNFATVNNTILHEIAHALTEGHFHDEVWQAMCVKIGAIPDPLWGEDVVKPALRFQAICPECQHIWRRDKLPKAKLACDCQRDKPQSEMVPLEFKPTS